MRRDLDFTLPLMMKYKKQQFPRLNLPSFLAEKKKNECYPLGQLQMANLN